MIFFAVFSHVFPKLTWPRNREMALLENRMQLDSKIEKVLRSFLVEDSSYLDL